MSGGVDSVKLATHPLLCAACAPQSASFLWLTPMLHVGKWHEELEWVIRLHQLHPAIQRMLTGFRRQPYITYPRYTTGSGDHNRLRLLCPFHRKRASRGMRPKEVIDPNHSCLSFTCGFWKRKCFKNSVFSRVQGPYWLIALPTRCSKRCCHKQMREGDNLQQVLCDSCPHLLQFGQEPGSPRKQEVSNSEEWRV